MCNHFCHSNSIAVQDAVFLQNRGGGCLFNNGVNSFEAQEIGLEGGSCGCRRNALSHAYQRGFRQGFIIGFEIGRQDF